MTEDNTIDAEPTLKEVTDPKLRAAVLAMMEALGRDELVMLEVVDKGGGKWGVFKDVTIVDRRGKISNGSEQVSPDYPSEAAAKKHIKLITFS